MPAVLSVGLVAWLVAAAAALGAMSAGGLTWYVKGAQVDRLQLQLDRASDDIATRDKANAELQRSQKALVESLGRQNAAIEVLAATGRRNAEVAAGLLAKVQEGNRATRSAIDSLTARINGPGVAVMTCRQALEELRGELLK